MPNILTVCFTLRKVFKKSLKFFTINIYIILFVHFASFILGYTFVKAFVAEFSIGDLQAPVPTKNLNVFYRLKINWFTIFEPCDCRWWYTSGWTVNIQIVVKNNRKFAFRHWIWANFRRHWKIKFKVKCSKLKKKK